MPDPLGHVTRYSDSSLYDEVCTLCGATDAGTGLRYPCPNRKKEPEMHKNNDGGLFPEDVSRGFTPEGKEGPMLLKVTGDLQRLPFREMLALAEAIQKAMALRSTSTVADYAVAVLEAAEGLNPIREKKPNVVHRR